MSWTSIGAVIAGGLLVAGPFANDPRALHFAELCTTAVVPGDDAGTINVGRIFMGAGLVVVADPGGRLLTVDHENITGLMPAMNMMFRVKSRDLIEHLRPSDRIRFRIDGSNMTIVAIEPEQRAE